MMALARLPHLLHASTPLETFRNRDLYPSVNCERHWEREERERKEREREKGGRRRDRARKVGVCLVPVWFVKGVSIMTQLVRYPWGGNPTPEDKLYWKASTGPIEVWGRGTTPKS
jgi:hypothetical protein